MKRGNRFENRKFKAALKVAIRTGAITCAEEVNYSNSSSNLYGEYFLTDTKSNLLAKIDSSSIWEELIFGINYFTKNAYKRRQKDTGWGYAFATPLIPFVALYYAIDRRTITPICYQTSGVIIYCLLLYLLNLLVSDMNDVVKVIIYILTFTWSIPLQICLAKLGISDARAHARYILNGNSLLKNVGTI